MRAIFSPRSPWRAQRAAWCLLLAPLLGLLPGCSLITTPVEAAAEVTSTVVVTAAKVVTAPVRWGADRIAHEDSEDQ